jgi:hypothetical protein
MKTISISDEFDCSADTFWEKYILDEAFFERLNPHIQVKKREVLERRESGDELYRKVKNTPSVEPPGIMKKIIGDDVSYIEESWFNRKTKAYRYKVTSPAAGKRLDFNGTISVTPLGESRCRRDMNATIKVDVMLVGGQIENQVAKQVEDGYRANTNFVRQEIKKQA